VQKTYRIVIFSIAPILWAMMLISSVALAAGDTTPPDTQRNFRFTYHSDIGPIDPNAHRVEAWIPLPREDQFQSVTNLEVDTPVHHEIVDQQHNGNRLLHL
jgi:hypothetical protein